MAMINYSDDFIEYDNRHYTDQLWSLGIIMAVSIIITVMILGGLYCNHPRLYIQELYVPALNNPTETTTLSTSIFIDLEFRRAVAFTRHSYPDFKLCLLYGLNRSFPVANYTVAGFSMGYKSSVHKKVAVEASGLPWEDALNKVSGGSTVAFLVELVQKYKFEYRSIDLFYQIRSSEAEVVAAVAKVWVDGSGDKVSKKPIRLH